MLTLFTDFNATTSDGLCYILVHGDNPVDRALLREGETVLLYQDEDDFEVEAVIRSRFLPELGYTTFVAIPDWPTKRTIDPGCDEACGNSVSKGRAARTVNAKT